MDLEGVQPGRKVKCRFCGHQFVPPLSEVAKPPIRESSVEELAEAAEAAKAVPIKKKWWGDFISPATRMRVVFVAGVILLVLSLVSICSDYLQLDFLKRAGMAVTLMEEEEAKNPEITKDELWEKVEAEGLVVTEEDGQANDDRQRIVGWSYFAGFMAFFVAFLVWEYRAYKNLPPLQAEQIRFTPAGAVAWYFCPIANLWQPCKAMNDIWHGSDPGKLGIVPKAGSSFVLLWWLVQIVEGGIGQVSFRISGTGETIQGFVMETHVSIGSTVVGLISAVMTLAIVRFVSQRQAVRWGELSRQQAYTRQNGKD